MGKPIPDSIHIERMQLAEGKGLKLSRGPDSRSLNGKDARMAEMMRGVFGMPE